jgi:glyoxylase-like metal-dependent hydrolase (beta-lactamase superfamily II)
MKIGNFELYSILTSGFRLDGGAMFGIIPKPLWEKKAPADKLNRIEMVTRSLLLVDDERRILIDTGNGDKWEEKLRKIYDIDPEMININKSLHLVGLTSEDITDVICTHLHFDHVGGNTSLKNGKIAPTFLNAKYWIQRDNWELANAPSGKDQGSFREEDWRILAENGMIELVDGKEQFIPGIEILLSHGHTTGQMHPIISDDKQKIIYGGDLIPMAAHIALPWVMAYDINPVLTIQEKKKLLPQIVDEQWILFFEHDPQNQAAIIKYDGRNFSLDHSIVIND